MKKPFHTRPLMIAVGGLSGSGKTTLGHALGHTLPNAIFLDSDVVKKKMFGVDPLTPLPDAAYSADQIQKFISYIRDMAAKQMRNHDIVIVTGLFIDETSKREQMEFARKNHADFIGLYMNAPLSTIFQRFQERGDTPSDASLDVLKRQAQQLLTKTKRDEKWVVLDAEQPFETVLNDALKALEKFQKRRHSMHRRPRHYQLPPNKNP